MNSTNFICGSNLNYDAPFFVREKKSKDGQKSQVKNDTPLELTEKMIKEAVEKDLKRMKEIKNTK